MSSLYDQLLATAQAYTTAHNERNITAIDAINSLCSPSCVHRGGPKPVQQPQRSNAEYSAFNQEVFKIFTTYNAEVTDMIVDERKRKVAIYLHANGTADVGEYENEYVITLTMTEDGKQVQDQYDFIDSHTMIEWVKKLGGFAKDFGRSE